MDRLARSSISSAIAPQRYVIRGFSTSSATIASAGRRIRHFAQHQLVNPGLVVHAEQAIRRIRTHTRESAPSAGRSRPAARAASVVACIVSIAVRITARYRPSFPPKW